MEARELEVSVISDLHLATHASKAKKVLKYLKSIHPKVLVLNGDIIDSWRFSRSYFPKPHLKVIRHFIKMMEKGVQLYYITGNHDDFLRKFNQFELGKLKLVNQLTLELDGKQTWIIHGDIFDPPLQKSKWLGKLGAASKGFLTIVNKGVNHLLQLWGRKEIIIYKTIKNKLVREKTDLSSFEKKVAKAAIERKCDTVICGHTHVPRFKHLTNEEGEVDYINCGDWVENFTAAEYVNGDWSIYYYEDNDEEQLVDEPDIPTRRELYESLYRELAMVSVK